MNNALAYPFHELTADDCFDCSIKLIDWERHRAIIEIRAGSPMYDVKPVDDDVAAQNRQATVLER